MKFLLSLVLLCAALSTVQSQDVLPDGLNQDNIDAVVRIRNSSGTGTGECVAELKDHYVFLTNHHVAGGKGSDNTLDVWNNGRLAQNIRTKVQDSYFHPTQSKDIAVIYVPKSSFDGPMPVIELAPYGNDSKLKPDQEIWQVGCDSGNWVNAERGKILKISNGLIYYLPTSIPGNSGGPIYDAAGKYQIGVTAWYTTVNVNGRKMQVGLAMTSDRVRDIIAKRVSTFPELPSGAAPIQPGPFLSDQDVIRTAAIALPRGAQQLPLASQECPDCQPQSPLVAAPVAVQTETISVETGGWRDPGSSLDGRRRRRPQPDANPEPSEQDPFGSKPKPPNRPRPTDPPSDRGGEIQQVAQQVARAADACERIAGTVEQNQAGLLDLFKRRERDAKPPETDAEMAGMVAAIKTDTAKLVGGMDAPGRRRWGGGLFGFGLIPDKAAGAIYAAAALVGSILLFGQGWVGGVVRFFTGQRTQQP